MKVLKEKIYPATSKFELFSLFNLTNDLRINLFEPMLENNSKIDEFDTNRNNDVMDRIYLAGGLSYEIEKTPQRIEFFWLLHFQHCFLINDHNDSNIDTNTNTWDQQSDPYLIYVRQRQNSSLRQLLQCAANCLESFSQYMIDDVRNNIKSKFKTTTTTTTDKVNIPNTENVEENLRQS